jgi:hypothetical protein
MKTSVVSYRTKWPTGWKSEWFYVKIDEKKEKLVQSPLELTFGLTRPQCNMTPGAPCPDAVCWNLLSVARGSNGRCSDVNRVLTQDGNSSVNLASQGHCAGVFIGI